MLLEEGARVKGRSARLGWVPLLLWEVEIELPPFAKNRAKEPALSEAEGVGQPQEELE